MASGTGAFIAVGVESATGAATNAWSAAPIEGIYFTTEDLQVTRTDIDAQNLIGVWDIARVYNGAQKVEGSIACEIHPIQFGYLLRSVFDVTTNVNSSTYATSNAVVRDHRFVAGQTQFQTGSGSDLPTLTLHIFRGPAIGVGTSFVYYNCAGTSLEFNIEAGQLAKATVQFLGRDYGYSSLATSPGSEVAEGFLWSTASIFLGGTYTSIFESLTIRLDNNLTAIQKLDGRLRPDTIKRDGFRTVTVNGRVGFERFKEFNDFINGSEQTLKAWFVGKAISSGFNEQLVLDMPRFRYSTMPLATQGPGRYTVDFTGRAIYDPNSGYPLVIDLVNTRTSAYAVNTDT